MSKLAGKSILITGASQGLGCAMALRFASEGAAGLSLVARHADRLNVVRDEIRKIAPNIDMVTIEADVSKPRDIERIVATTLAQFKGQLDVLVNNASTNWALADAIPARLSGGRFSRSARYESDRPVS